jgi:hypothetical protein
MRRSFMAKKPAKKKKSKKAPTKVSVTALQREIKRVLGKMDGARTRKAKTLRNKLKTFAAATDCGQTLLLDIGS